MLPVSALEWYEATHLDGTKGLAANSPDGVRFFIRRHGEGRKYWGVTYPDGTYTHNALTQAEAKLQAESWKPDPELVQLLDDDALSVLHDSACIPSTGPDATPAAAVESASPDGGDVDLVMLVDTVVIAARNRDVPRGGRGWGYQDAGESQRRALIAIEELVKLRGVVATALRAQVAMARNNTGTQWYSNAATWSDVGAALGVSKQSAQAKYGKTG